MKTTHKYQQQRDRDEFPRENESWSEFIKRTNNRVRFEIAAEVLAFAALISTIFVLAFDSLGIPLF